MKKRTFLLSAAAATGALVVGWGVLPARSRKGAPELMAPKDGEMAMNGWLKIAPDGAVVMAMPRSEMGQGIHTALPMLVAEELDLPLEKVRLQTSGFDKIYGNAAMLVGSLPFHPLLSEGAEKPAMVRGGEWVVGKLAREIDVIVTGGSSSVADAWGVVRQAAATVRGQLLGAAALRWKLPIGELAIENGVVTHKSGQKAHFGELAKEAAATPPGDVAPKAPEQFKLIGQSALRGDVAAKSFGQARFGLDVRLPGMLFAAVRMAPQLGGAPAHINPAPALAKPGVLRVVPFPAYSGGTAGFAVVGQSTWHAREGAQAVDVRWAGRPAGDLSTAAIAKSLAAAVATEAGFPFHKAGEPLTDAQIQSAPEGERFVAEYSAPYLAHMTMEPMNCTVHIEPGPNGDRVTVWSPTQMPAHVQSAAARVAGVPVENVTVHVTYLGGGFGRRLEVDFVSMATRVAMDCGGKPVQVMWPREEDTRHDFYRPAGHARLVGIKNKAGEVTHLQIRSAGDAISPRWMDRIHFDLAGPVDTPDKTTAEGLFDLPYGFENQHMAHVATQSGVPIGFWRSVGHSHNAFFSESFVDELAHWAGKDPLEFRRGLLRGAPRYLAVLNLAAEKAGWGKPLAPGRALGVALHKSFGSIVAQVAEVSVELVGGKKQPRVHSVHCAVDCGTVVNPNIVAQQMESSVVFGLSAALYGRIDIEGGAVQQANFADSPLVKLAQAPVVHTHLVASKAAPKGVGEPGLPPLAPAVANALFSLTKQRLRQLPLVLA